MIIIPIIQIIFQHTTSGKDLEGDPFCHREISSCVQMHTMSRHVHGGTLNKKIDFTQTIAYYMGKY
jgi:hypothetical protein